MVDDDNENYTNHHQYNDSDTKPDIRPYSHPVLVMMMMKTHPSLQT